jgi:hypothetical protein
MADKFNTQSADVQRARTDIPKTVRTSREKVTLGSAAPAMETAPEWSLENVPSQSAAVHNTPIVGETRTISIRTLPAPRDFEAAVVSALVWLAKRTRQKPGASLAVAAASGIAAGWCVRRI